MANNNANSSSDPTIAKSGKGFGALVDMADRVKPTTSGNVFHKPLPGGTSITVSKPKGTQSITCPLSGVVSDNKFIFTRGGTIGGIIPSNMISNGKLLTLNLSAGWNYVYAGVQSFSGLVQSVTIAIQSAPVEPIGQTEGIPPTSFKIPLYAVLRDNQQAVRMFGCGNINISALKVLSYAKSQISCGEYPLIDVWTWQTTIGA
jgi:hypothetical protein